MSLSQDDIIELKEFNSPSSTKSNFKKRLKLPDNKIRSPPTQSPEHSITKDEVPNSLFTKTQPAQSKKLPVPKPRKLKLEKKIPLDLNSESQGTSETSNADEKHALYSDTSESAHPESTFSTKSDTKSYKEKLKDRFKSIKQQAGSSVAKAHTIYTLKSNTEKIMSLNSSLRSMAKENKIIEANLRGYTKSQIQEHVTELDIETYDFFCKDNGFDETLNKQSVINLEETEDFHKSSDGLVDDLHHTKKLVQSTLPENVKFNVALSESELFWQPLRNKLDLQAKLEDNEPRYIAEEGLYTEENTSILSDYFNNIWEQRLLSINDKKWFNCQGEIEKLQNPCTKASYRPIPKAKNKTQLDTKYVMATLTDLTECDSVLTHSNSIINLNIHSVKFKHHPLFSAEHVLEQQVINLYDIYRKNLTSNKLHKINKRLEALRQVRKTLRNALTEEDDLDMTRLQNCTDEIRQMRNTYFEEGKNERNTLKLLLKTWKALKEIRQQNKYSNTAIKLAIRKEKCHYENEKEIQDKNISQICAEIEMELELDFKKKLESYKAELHEWKSKKSHNPQQVKDLNKPKKPIYDVNTEVVQRELTEKYQESFKPPGEPILHFSINYDNEISENVENPKEKVRRNAAKMTKIYFRMFCNGLEVCKSKLVALNNSFTCLFNEIFSISVAKIPENILIEIYEQSTVLLKRKLGEIKMIIPPSHTTLNQSKTSELNFEKNEAVSYKHEGVGSKIKLQNVFEYCKLTDMESGEELCTGGTIMYNIGWDVATRNITDSRDSSMDFTHSIESILNSDGSINVNKLKEWITENNPDPQDPKNFALFEYIRTYGDLLPSTHANKTYFRCNPDLNLTEFCSSNDIEENLRFQILQLRNQNEPEFVGMVVPNRIKEIPVNLISDYKQHKEEENKNNFLLENYDSEIEIKRINGKKCLKQIHMKVFQLCRNAENNLLFEDVVNEKIITYLENVIEAILLKIINWFKFQPAISYIPKPAEKKIRQLPLSAEVTLPLEVIIKVTSGINIPQKCVKRSSTRPNSNNEEVNTQETKIKPFLVISYQGASTKTSTSEGPNPVWNEELRLPLNSSHTDYLNPSSLNGSISIHLFDENAQTEEGLKTKHNWLGFLEIPLSTMCGNKLEGLFRVSIPSVLFEYEQDTERERQSINSSSSLLQSYSQCTYLSMKLSLRPNIPKLSPSMDELQSNELPYILQHILEWNELYNINFPNRRFSALVIDINGKTTCLTRYIKTLEPPQLHSDGFEVTAEQCARYVSMIPFTNCNKFYQNICLSTDQLLKLMCGSILDHAIALTCYMISLDIEAWLLLGFGLPNGSTAYVFMREYVRDSPLPNHYIYDVVSACKYNITDPFCPLQKIYCAINEHNIWANVQRTDQIAFTLFDFTSRSDWLPLFSNQITAPTNSIQQKLIYSSTPDCRMLEVKLDKKIRKKIMKLRKHHRTIWNHSLVSTFKNAIMKFEMSSLHGRVKMELLQDMNPIFSSHTISGYGICLPYNNIESIVAMVVNTDICSYESSEVEFALVVAVHSYPNHVFVVWVFAAALSKVDNI